MNLKKARHIHKLAVTLQRLTEKFHATQDNFYALQVQQTIEALIAISKDKAEK